MLRKLKVYQTSQGFYDLAVAAPSMKAALKAWGAGSNLFHQGVASESKDDKIIASALAKPGTVLRRPVGSSGPFAENAKLPSVAALGRAMPQPPETPKQVRAAEEPLAESSKADIHARRKAAELYAKGQLKRDRERQKAEAAIAKANERRKLAIQKAEKALEQARRSHDDFVQGIEDQRAALDLREEAEARSWETLRQRLEDDLQSARKS